MEMKIYRAKCFKLVVMKNEKIKFYWYETPFFKTQEDAIKHAKWWVNKHPKYIYSHCSEFSVF